MPLLSIVHHDAEATAAGKRGATGHASWHIDECGPGALVFFSGVEPDGSEAGTSACITDTNIRSSVLSSTRAYPSLPKDERPALFSAVYVFHGFSITSIFTIK